ncbi:MAG TPA: multidrug effflux MFS transporter [Sediminibacterium sp.]|nr:multidrug effflux MFS transporter [Sediminibacterium sp.]
MEKTIPGKARFTVILIMGLLTAIGPLSIDMYLPAFPDIARHLHTDISRVTLSLSSFFIGISAGQLLYGPLLERFGRKPPLYVGLILYLFASIGCALSGSVQQLIVFRLFQALGGCAGMVAARAMVRDLFDVHQNARIFSLLMLVVSVSPIIAPALGGYITAAWGWRYVFAALILVILLILAGTYYYLPESKSPNPAYSLKPIPILRDFASVLKHPQFITYALTGAISYAGMYAYLGGAPYVFMDLYRVTAAGFGWIFAIIAAGLIGSSQLNNIALNHFSSAAIIRIASLAQTLTGLLFTTLVLTGHIQLYSTVLLLFLFLCCQGFIFPNATALALAKLGHSAGNASGLIGAIQMTIGAGASALIGLLQNTSAFPMAAVMTGCALTAFLVFTWSRRMLLQKKN